MTQTVTQALNIGTLAGVGSPFFVPVDIVTQKNALFGISGSGKTCTGFVLGEEFYGAGLPWTCFDGVGNWWGLRSNIDGTPSRRQIVVIGGKHADIPLERDAGSKIAEAIILSGIFAVIDFSLDSKTNFRKFATDFVEQLLRMEPPVPHHVFVEEARELVPQKPVGNVMQLAHAAIEKFVLQGRNKGYGFTIIGQRPAPIAKEVISQCENIICHRIGGAHDKKALREWFIAKGADFDEAKVHEQLREIGQLKDGEALVWSPFFMKCMERVQIRQRTCFHPGETRKVGQAVRSAKLVDVGEFVEKLKRELSRTQVGQHTRQQPEVAKKPTAGNRFECETLEVREMLRAKKEVEALRGRLAEVEQRATAAEMRASDVARLWAQQKERLRKELGPLYSALRAVFEEVGERARGDQPSSTWDVWLDRAKGGRRKMLEVMIERKELTKKQLATLAGLSPRSVNDYMSWFTGNGLFSASRGVVRLNEVPA